MCCNFRHPLPDDVISCLSYHILECQNMLGIATLLWVTISMAPSVLQHYYREGCSFWWWIHQECEPPSGFSIVLQVLHAFSIKVRVPRVEHLSICWAIMVFEHATENMGLFQAASLLVPILWEHKSLFSHSWGGPGLQNHARVESPERHCRCYFSVCEIRTKVAYECSVCIICVADGPFGRCCKLVYCVSDTRWPRGSCLLHVLLHAAWHGIVSWVDWWRLMSLDVLKGTRGGFLYSSHSLRLDPDRGLGATLISIALLSFDGLSDNHSHQRIRNA